MDHRAVRLALGLTIAGASMLAAGVATWLVTAVGQVTSGLAARDLRLAALALLAGGAGCGLAMFFALATAGRDRAAGPPVPAGAAEFTRAVPGSPAPVPSLADPRSLMNPPPPSPPPLPSGKQPSGKRPAGEVASGEVPPEEVPSGKVPSGDTGPASRVWWRAARSPASSGEDTSEEWLRSLRGPAIQQPPPHSAE
jgi:hypothetical protein